MRDAMLQIRGEFGDDAVILETTRMDEGVEVSAAIDYDPDLVAQDVPTSAPARGGTINCRDDEDEHCFTLGKGDQAAQWYEPEPAGGRMGAAADQGIRQVSHEVRSIRCLLEAQLSRLIWDEQSRRTPESAAIMRNFSNLGLAPDVVARLVDEMGELRGLEDMWTTPLAQLSQSIPVRDKDMVCAGGVFAIVGPTGVGKTTTIAKLAARYALHHTAGDIALVTTDGFRVAAREQLETFGHILGSPVYQANDGQALGGLLQSLQDRALVLIDTAGMSQKDVHLAGQLTCLGDAGFEMEVLLALPANAQTGALEQIVDAFLIAQPSACILTKTDEASSLGGAFSALIRSGLPLAYITNGQRVPEDLHFAKPCKAWLMKAAVELMRRSPVELGEDYMSDHFGARQIREGSIHACA